MGKKIPFLLGFIMLAIAIWLQVTTLSFPQRLISRLEDLAYDIQLRTKIFTHRHRIQTSVVIVDIDDKSLKKIGRWPWPRSKLGDLLTRLHNAGAVVVAFDILFPQPEENIAEQVLQMLKQKQLTAPTIDSAIQKIAPLFDFDAQFAESLKQGDNVIAYTFVPRNDVVGALPTPAVELKTPDEKQLDLIQLKGYMSAIPLLQEATKNGGFINVFADEDGVIRRVPLLMRYQNNLYPSLALEATRVYLLGKIGLATATYGKTTRLEGVNLGDRVIPTDDKGQVVIPFRGHSFTFPYYSAVDVMNNHFPQDAFTGKLVFIGTSATGLGDLKTTAVQSVFPGVEVQATIADGILSNNFPYRPAWSRGLEIFLTCFLGIIFTIWFPYLGPRLLTVMIIAVPSGLVFANNLLWEKTGLIIAILVPILLTFVLALTNMIYGYLFESRRREHLKEMFGQYVPAKHIDEMLVSSGEYGLYGEDREMTVLFADIRNFTTLSEGMSATQLKELLSEFFTPMTEIIFKHRGTIDKYVGDLIMAFWGAPLKDKRHAAHAIAAALEMEATILKLAPVFAARGLPEIKMGIGLNSGIMSVGDMGSKFRRNYTVLGDAVNLASRVEGLSKFYGVTIVVTESVIKNQKGFVFRQLDRVRVKGKNTAIAIYEVMGHKSEISPELDNEIKLSEQALKYYFNRDWQNARKIFLDLNRRYLTVKLYQLYLYRLQEYEKIPPPDDWGGVYQHHEK